MVGITTILFLLNLGFHNVRIYGTRALYRYDMCENTYQQDNSGARSYDCKSCGRQFYQKCNLDDHMVTHTGERPYGCTVCDKAFTTSRSRTRHMYTHGIGKLYNCSVATCAKNFTQSCNKARHEKNVHGIKSA